MTKKIDRYANDLMKMLFLCSITPAKWKLMNLAERRKFVSDCGDSDLLPAYESDREWQQHVVSGPWRGSPLAGASGALLGCSSEGVSGVRLFEP